GTVISHVSAIEWRPQFQPLWRMRQIGRRKASRFQHADAAGSTSMRQAVGFNRVFPKHRTALGLAAFLMLSAATTPASAFTVFDPSNYSQNLLTAARALIQINNQIKSLQNEAQMLLNMGKDLQSLKLSDLNTMMSGLGQI